MNLVYPFCHASLWHLLANVWMLLLLVVRCRARGRHLVLAYAVAVSVPSADWGWWSVVGEEPTVGASGMVFALLPVYPFSQLERKEERCIKGCSACKNQCPVGIKLEQDGMRNGECIACEACVSACPRFPDSNISRWDLKLTGGKAFISMCLKAAAFFLMGCALGLCRFL